MVSNYPKMIISTPRSDSGTLRPKDKFLSDSLPSTTCINDCTCIVFPFPNGHTMHAPPLGGWSDETFNNFLGHWLQCIVCGLLVRADMLRRLCRRRLRGQTRGLPFWALYLLQYIYLHIVGSTSLAVALSP
jgi:hypothetical protein